MNTRKHSGPMIVPCGTPDVALVHFDYSNLLAVCGNLTCLLFLRYDLQSSANSLILEVTLFGRSFMNTRKHSGPRIVPCGTPDVALVRFENDPLKIYFKYFECLKPV